MSEDMRAVFAKIAQAWRAQDVYVGASGNFTAERVLTEAKAATKLHSSDVSLYSSALGALLSDAEFRLELNPTAAEDWGWLEPYLGPGPGRVATLMLCSTMMSIRTVQRGEVEPTLTAFGRRQLDGYRRQWDSLHRRSTEKVERIAAELKIASYQAMDVVDFAETAPAPAPFTAFVPGSVGRYERLYATMEDVFSWDAPAFEPFTLERLSALAGLLMSREHWLLARTESVEDLEDHLVGVVRASRSSIYLYASQADRTWLTRRTDQRIQPARVRRLDEAPGADATLHLTRLEQPVFTALRSQYLNPGIRAMPAKWSFGVMVDDALAGCFALGDITVPWADVYLSADFAVRPTEARLLSKLVVAAILSEEARLLFQQAWNHTVRTIGTTAFTAKAVSAKYRGLFDLTRRDEEHQLLHYKARAGRWPLAEAYRWWHQKASREDVSA